MTNEQPFAICKPWPHIQLSTPTTTTAYADRRLILQSAARDYNKDSGASAYAARWSILQSAVRDYNDSGARAYAAL
jgi:hypothetical protein